MNLAIRSRLDRFFKRCLIRGKYQSNDLRLEPIGLAKFQLTENLFRYALDKSIDMGYMDNAISESSKNTFDPRTVYMNMFIMTPIDVKELLQMFQNLSEADQDAFIERIASFGPSAWTDTSQLPYEFNTSFSAKR